MPAVSSKISAAISALAHLLLLVVINAAKPNAVNMLQSLVSNAGFAHLGLAKLHNIHVAGSCTDD